MFRRCLFGRFYVQKVLCSENPIISSSYVQKVIFVQKVLVQKILCSELLMFRSSYIQKLLFSECPVLKKRETTQKTPQEEAQDVAQETSQEARKTRHEEQNKQRCIGVGYVKQDAAQDAAPPRTLRNKRHKIRRKDSSSRRDEARITAHDAAQFVTQKLHL